MYGERQVRVAQGSRTVDPDPNDRPGQGAPRVLVVDDSAAQRQLLQVLLGRWGYAVTACADAAEGLRLAAGDDVGLIVLDWMMPGMTGPEFCRRLRMSGRTAYQYVILLTSKSETSDLSEGLAAGADDFLTKPVRAPELKARLNAGARIVSTQRELVEKTRTLESAFDEISGLYGAIDADLAEARRLQQSLLQDTRHIFGNADVALWLQASGHIGGDMVGYFDVSERVFGFYSIDVSGHGVAAAMVVARAAGMLSHTALAQNMAVSVLGDGVISPLPPAMAAARLNTQLLREFRGERYLTMCLGFLDQRNGLVRMVQAGHPNPLILRADGRIERAGEGGMPVGLFAEARFEETTLRLGPGDRLLLHSDGLTECPDAGGGWLEEEGLMLLCHRFRRLDGDAFLAAIARELADRMDNTDLPDDASALLVSYRRPERAR